MWFFLIDKNHITYFGWAVNSSSTQSTQIIKQLIFVADTLLKCVKAGIFICIGGTGITLAVFTQD